MLLNSPKIHTFFKVAKFNSLASYGLPRGFFKTARNDEMGQIRAKKLHTLACNDGFLAFFAPLKMREF